MKFKKIILPAVAGLLLLSGCDDNKMEWVEPDGSVTIADIPLELAEKIANYDYIKAYAKQYTPNMTIGLGLGADEYISDDAYRAVCDDNFQVFVTGNAMKHQSVVGNSGSYNFDTIDEWLDLVPTDVDVYGHNFIWHTQQNQTYLKSLIAPTMNIVNDDEGGIANLISNGDFEEGNINGWGAWSSAGCTASISAEGDGYNSNYSMELYNPEAGENYSAQAYYTLPTINWEEEVGETYVIKFYVKSEQGNSNFQTQIQNRTSYSGVHYNAVSLDPGVWTLYEFEYEVTESDVSTDPDHLTIDFGYVTGYTWIDDVEFGKKVESSDPMVNVLTGDDSTFDDGTTGNWGSWGGDEWGVAEGMGADGSDCVYLLKSADGNAWDAQFAYTFSEYLDPNETYMIQFDAKSNTAAGQLQFQYQNGTTYQSQGGYETFDVGTDWITYQKEFCTGDNGYEDVDRIILNFGAVAGTYYVDNIKFGIKIDTDSSKKLKSKKRKATTITYTLMSDEEKKEALLGAMEDWIKTISEHIHDKIGDRLFAWDVINEPITDNCEFRGIDNHFGGTDDDGVADSAPVETEEDGLTLNWANGTGNGHWYWGYYLGMDYATKAFEYARKYNPNALLFVNDYNLETSPNKLAKLIEFVDYIDQNGTVKVDGIGTQMHVASDVSEDDVRTMFTTLAATGKMIRVTELDVSLGTTSPSADQLEEQANTYEMIVSAYKELIPESQQSGITAWTLSDNSAEHEYWLNGDSPNLFDSNYERKHAYKGFCDGLAGFDISTTFTGDDWEKAYETDETTEEEAEEVSSEE
ncbi:MAG: endo-1,4-beta-xylanase [Prevotella sp.]|nr:endo-1,4-beta-xylanase [Prevotella sp.]